MHIKTTAKGSSFKGEKVLKRKKYKKIRKKLQRNKQNKVTTNKKFQGPSQKHENGDKT